MKGGWTPEMLACASNAKKQGLSASQIAARIEARFGIIFTRNAIIGALSRLRKNTALKPKAAPPPKPQASLGPQPPPPGHPLHGLPVIVKRLELNPQLRADGHAHTLLSLPKNACKWPVSGESKHILFCGRPATVGPYCDNHAALAWGKPQLNTRPLSEVDHPKNGARHAAR